MQAARVVLVALLVFSGTVIVLTLGATPAFNPRLVSETITGEGRTPLNTAMYDKGTYEFQRGHGFLMADALVSTDGDAWLASLAPEVASAHVAAAREALGSAVRLDPGNAHAWAHLGWAQARSGDLPKSLDAWRASAAIAPASASLAELRLDLVGLLTATDNGARRLTDADRAAIDRDLSLLEQVDGGGFAAVMKVNPHLAGLRTAVAGD
jgi:tetratricopeptide (TPR) repeat protein